MWFSFCCCSFLVDCCLSYTSPKLYTLKIACWSHSDGCQMWMHTQRGFVVVILKMKTNYWWQKKDTLSHLQQQQQQQVKTYTELKNNTQHMCEIKTKTWMQRQLAQLIIRSWKKTQSFSTPPFFPFLKNTFQIERERERV